jgi:HK97 family phage portal protein
MGLITRLRAAGSAFLKSSAGAPVPSPGFLPTLGSTPSASGVLISQGTAMSVSAVYACVTIRSQDVARCRPRLFRRGDKRVPENEVTDHPVAKLFTRPNRIQTWFEFSEQMQGALLLRGNAYAAILRDGRGRVQELIPINPDAVLVMESSDGSIFYNVNRLGLFQIAVLSRFPSTIAAEDILHIRGLSFNALVALSTIGVARDSIGVAMGLEQQAARWMANGSRPSVVLQSKKTLTDAAAKRLKTQWDEWKAGLQNTGSTVVLEDGLEAKPLTLTSVDLAFMEQRGFQLGDIARFYRVPPHKLGLDISFGRGVNLVQLDQDYCNNTIMPDLHRWEQKFERDFDLASDGLTMDMDERELLRADINSRYAAARIGLGGASFLKVNEVRAGENLPDVPNGDVIYQPANLASIGSDISGDAPDGAGRPSEGTMPVQDPPGAGHK